MRDALAQEDNSVGGGGVGATSGDTGALAALSTDGTSGDTGALTVLSTDGAEVQRVRQGIWDTTGNSEDILKMTSTVGDVWMPFVDPLHVGSAPEPDPEHEVDDIDTPSDGVDDGEINVGETVGRYRITRYLGQGQFGTVWKAEADGWGEGIAVKTMEKAKCTRDPRNKLLVQNEIRSMQQVSHPNVVRLHEPLYSNTHIYLVQEYCETDLKKYMNQPLGVGLPSRAPLNEADAKGLMRDLAAGLQALRSVNIIHRDLKDENLLLSTMCGGVLRARPVLKIADFGFAKQLIDLTVTITEVGSPAYMAPEVFRELRGVVAQIQPDRGHHAGYDAKADLWSVGCILYGMLCKGLVFSDQVRSKQDLIAELAQEIRGGVQKRLPKSVEHEDGRGFEGPVAQYFQAADETAASGACKALIAQDAGVRADQVTILGAREAERSPALRSQGKVIVRYKRAVDVSAECADLLERLLRHNPAERISWEDFFAHPWLQ